MRTFGPWSLSSLLESILLFLQFVAWCAVAAFLVLPFLPIEGTTFNFTLPLRHGFEVAREGPGGTWTFEAVVAGVETPHDRAWIASLVAVPFVALIALVLGQLRAVFCSLRDGSPFVAVNARRIRRIGLGVLAFEVLRVVVTITIVAPALERLDHVPGGSRIQAVAWPNGTALFLGCAVLVLAEVFRRGTLMHDEQALTV